MFTTLLRQPANKSVRPLRSSGLLREERDALLLFCLADDYPRELIVGRTGTRYYLNGVRAAHQLYKNLHGPNRTALFTKDERGHVAKWSDVAKRYVGTPDFYTPRECHAPQYSPFTNMVRVK